MQDQDLEIQKLNKEKILKLLGKTIHQKRIDSNKGINKFSFEYDIGNGLLTGIEAGRIDSKLTTIWKIANAFGIKCSDLIILIEKELGEDFNFYN